MMRVNSQVLTSTLLAHSAIALSVATVSTMGTVIVQPAQMKTILPATLALLGAQRTRHATKSSPIHVNIGSLSARIVVALLPPVPSTTISVIALAASTKRLGTAAIAHPAADAIRRRQSTVLGSSST